LNYEEFKPPVEAKDWDNYSLRLTDIAKKLEHAGAECIILCANTPHMAADFIQQKIKIPLIHIAEETAKEIAKHSIKKVALLGTKVTMEQAFFKQRLSNYHISTLIPEEEERNFIHSIILTELAKGVFSEETKKRFLEIISNLGEKGGEAIILGCTEIPMLIKPGDCNIKLFDTTLIHATAAVNFALEN
jgi:aspartate racemase